MYRHATVSDNVTVMLASRHPTVHSPDGEAVTIATQPRVSACTMSDYNDL